MDQSPLAAVGEEGELLAGTPQPFHDARGGSPAAADAQTGLLRGEDGQHRAMRSNPKATRLFVVAGHQTFAPGRRNGGGFQPLFGRVAQDFFEYRVEEGAQLTLRVVAERIQLAAKTVLKVQRERRDILRESFLQPGGSNQQAAVA